MKPVTGIVVDHQEIGGGVPDSEYEVVVKVRKQDVEALRAELTAALEMSFPKREMGGTYELDRIYHIDIKET